MHIDSLCSYYGIDGKEGKMEKAERKAFDAGFKAGMNKKADSYICGDFPYYDEIYAMVYQYMYERGWDDTVDGGNTYVCRWICENMIHDLEDVLLRARFNCEQELGIGGYYRGYYR